MAKVYGIDLGTTYSAIATLDDSGMPEIIENFADSILLLASAVYFPEGGNPVIGKEAKNQVEIEADRVVQYVKREIGKSDAQTRTFDGVDYDPITISSLILKRMREYASEQGHEVVDVVITCPAYFGIEERNATRQAGTIAGLNVLDILNEPTGAALNYCSREFKENRKIMVYDLGGGTFDITLFDFAVDDGGKATIDVIRSGGNDRLGGIDWDARLFDYICELYEDENGVSRDEMDAELRQKIRSSVEDTKIALTNMTSKSFTVNYAGDSCRLAVTREKFEEITKDLIEQTMDFVHKLLSDTGVSAEQVDVVLLVGGSTRMPMVKSAVEAVFPGKVRVEQPDLAVAKGAALAAAVEFNEQIKKLIAGDGESVSSDETPVELSGDSFGEEQPRISKEKAAELMINVPDVFEGESVVSDKLSRSFGPATFSDGEYVIDNLLFVGDASPSEATKTYGTMSDMLMFQSFQMFRKITLILMLYRVLTQTTTSNTPTHC
jgi:molecular chaperone DnaK (HSP70)